MYVCMYVCIYNVYTYSTHLIYITQLWFIVIYTCVISLYMYICCIYIYMHCTITVYPCGGL